MRRELQFARASVRRRPMLALAGWAIPQGLPTAVSGLVIARSLDDGFLAARPGVGVTWLASYMIAAIVGAYGSRQLYRRLGEMVEPFRDTLVRLVVSGALHRGIRGGSDDGAVSRLTRHVESVRDSYAGLLVVVLSFAVTSIGVAAGLAALAPEIVMPVVAPFLVGLAMFVATLGYAANRERASILADDELASTVGMIFAGRRDVVATGAEERATAIAAEPISAQAHAERALARVAVIRSLCFAVGGWLPLLVILITGPQLAAQGLTAGQIMGALTYVLFGLQPALRTLISALGSSGLRFVVTLGSILDASPPPADAPKHDVKSEQHDLTVRNLTFAYGPHAEPVLRNLNLTIPEGEHVAIVGPSGIGKSTLANLVCGLLPPTSGEIQIGDSLVPDLSRDRLAKTRVLIPQEAYVFTASLWDNLTYLAPTSTRTQVNCAAVALGVESLIVKLGGYDAQVSPDTLSAGERQQIALVRAYLSMAPIVVLDEATCHLDPPAESRAESAMSHRFGTLIVIAHRISSAFRAHRILVLDGETAETGTHDSLLETSNLYRELVGHWNVPKVDHAKHADGTPSEAAIHHRHPLRSS